MTLPPYADLLGIDQVIAFDMGGTTAKLCCIENGRPLRRFLAARDQARQLLADMQKMLDKIREMAKNGDREGAEAEC